MTIFSKDALAALARLLEPLPWYKDALCAQVDPEPFFPEKGGSTREAKKVCAKCLVRGDCLEESLRRREYGVWAGTTEKERQKMRGAA